MSRLVAVIIGFIVGWIIYMIAMFMTTFVGWESLIFQPIVGAIASGVVVFVCFVGSLILKIPGIYTVWNSSRWWAAGMIAIGLFAMIFGSSLGWTEVYRDPETNVAFEGLSALVAAASYFAVIFAIVNWPIRKRRAGGALEAEVEVRG